MRENHKKYLWFYGFRLDHYGILVYCPSMPASITLSNPNAVPNTELAGSRFGTPVPGPGRGGRFELIPPTKGSARAVSVWASRRGMDEGFLQIITHPPTRPVSPTRESGLSPAVTDGLHRGDSNSADRMERSAETTTRDLMIAPLPPEGGELGFDSLVALDTNGAQVTGLRGQNVASPADGAAAAPASSVDLRCVGFGKEVSHVMPEGLSMTRKGARTSMKADREPIQTIAEPSTERGGYETLNTQPRDAVDSDTRDFYRVAQRIEQPVCTGPFGGSIPPAMFGVCKDARGKTRRGPSPQPHAGGRLVNPVGRRRPGHTPFTSTPGSRRRVYRCVGGLLLPSAPFSLRREWGFNANFWQTQATG